MELLLPWLGKHITLRRAAWLQTEEAQVYSSSPSSKPHPRAAIPHASVRKKRSQSHSSISTQTPGASHEMMFRQQNRFGTGRANSVPQHPLLPAAQSPLEGLLARHINKTFKFRKFSSLGLLTLLMEVAQNTEALNIS